MRYKDTIRLAKEALKHPELYNENELTYLKKALDRAKNGLQEKKLRRKRQKGFGYGSETD